MSRLLGSGVIAFATICEILPSVSSPSSVVKSHIETIILSASNLDSFLILLVAKESTLSFKPTESILESNTSSKISSHLILRAADLLFIILW